MNFIDILMRKRLDIKVYVLYGFICYEVREEIKLIYGDRRIIFSWSEVNWEEVRRR